jgi:N-acetylglutamate synthase-like GNAT family acetyltransferase
METCIEAARAQDLAEVFRLLEANGLPRDGLREHLSTTIVARRDGRVVGSAALELYSDGALLRSVAVSPALQRTGLGRLLTDRAIQMARRAAVPAVYLLTTTAERYFLRFGFERIARQDVPESVQASVEFKSACPSSAAVMRKSLRSVEMNGGDGEDGERRRRRKR